MKPEERGVGREICFKMNLKCQRGLTPKCRHCGPFHCSTALGSPRILISKKILVAWNNQLFLPQAPAVSLECSLSHGDEEQKGKLGSSAALMIFHLEEFLILSSCDPEKDIEYDQTTCSDVFW